MPKESGRSRGRLQNRVVRYSQENVASVFLELRKFAFAGNLLRKIIRKNNGFRDGEPKSKRFGIGSATQNRCMME